MTAAMALAAVLFAGWMTGMTGFGFSVLSVPLLLLVYQPHDVVVIVLCLVPITSIAVLFVPHLRGLTDRRLCATLSGLSVIGLPLGVWLFQRFDPSWLMLLVGVVLVGFAAFSLYSPDGWRLSTSLALPSGILGGILATSTGLSGPAVAMYVHGRRLAHDELVATMAAYVGVVSVCGLAVMAVQHEVTDVALERVAWLSPVAIAGVALGRWWARRNHARVERIAMHLLGLMGLLTIVRTVIN